MSKKDADNNEEEKEGYDVCQAIRELIEDGKQEGISLGRQEGISLGRLEGISLGKQEGIRLGRTEGRLEALIELVKEGLLKVEEAAKRMNLSVEEFYQRM